MLIDNTKPYTQTIQTVMPVMVTERSPVTVIVGSIEDKNCLVVLPPVVKTNTKISSSWWKDVSNKDTDISRQRSFIPSVQL